jgi:hypothetical protein
MSQLVYTEQELCRSHDYAKPQIEGGHRLHGGFDADGNYISPRTLVRNPAIEAWSQALRARGGELLAADSSLLSGIRYPSEAQSKLLIREGLGQTFWNSLTITGMIEARGRLLADATFPEFQPAIVDDISEMGIGHLNRGLLWAHGIDEGGEPDKGVGGHDVMWFALRDLAFGQTDYPKPQVPENIGRPEQPPQVPEIPLDIERTIYFLGNLLMIEFRAERGFSASEAILRDPTLFSDRRAEAERAAEIVGRIRADEEIHVSSLRLYLGELRNVRFKTRDGGTLPGDRVVDPLWEGIVRWATVDQPKLMAEQQRELLTRRVLEHPEGERILAEFNRLEDREG